MGAIEEKIRERIAKAGRITFADFMEMALYYPGLGYYTSGKDVIGDRGDFYTSPGTHPVFGALLAIQIEQMWRLLGQPDDFTMVEMGAGKGLLARDVLGYLPSLNRELAQSLRYLAIESGRPAMHWTEQALSETAEPESVQGCILSNELLDALPTHVVVKKGGRLLEVYVVLEDGRFAERLDGPSTPLLNQRLREEGVLIERLPEGYRAEVNLNVRRWAEDVARDLRKGFVITVDYGHMASELYEPERSQGTLMTYYRHTFGSDPYIKVGEQDITSHVDFTVVIGAGERQNLSVLGLTRQREFLMNLGFNAFLERLAYQGLSYEQYLANRMAMLDLVKLDGMGDFRVLVQGKGVGDVDLLGLKGAVEEAPGDVPLLRPEHSRLFEAKYPQYLPPWQPEID